MSGVGVGEGTRYGRIHVDRSDFLSDKLIYIRFPSVVIGRMTIFNWTRSKSSAFNVLERLIGECV